MTNIQELIQKNKESYIRGFEFVHEQNVRFAKDLIDAVIEDEEEENIKDINSGIKNNDIWVAGYNQAKHDTINRLKAIKEML
jgi:hypothetical protein